MLTHRRNRLRRQPARDWTAVSLGLITVATIIAATTVAAYINLAQAPATPPATPNQDALRLSTVPGLIAFFSLWAYIGVVSAGLVALFGTTAAVQRALVQLTAIAFYAQVFAVVIFAWIIILQTLGWGVWSNSP